MAIRVHLYLVALTVLCLFACHVLAINTTHSSSSSSNGLAGRNKQSRQYSTSYSNYASPSLYTSPVEAIVVGVLAVCGLSLFGLPLLMLFFNLFNGGFTNPGVSVIPTATTSVNTGRRKRNAAASNLLDPQMLAQVVNSLHTFMQSEEKMQMLQRLIS